MIYIRLIDKILREKAGSRIAISESERDMLAKLLSRDERSRNDLFQKGRCLLGGRIVQVTAVSEPSGSPES